MEDPGIALSGMQSAQTRVAVSARNVANLLTEDFGPQRAIQVSDAGGGSTARVQQASQAESASLAREVVGQIQASTQYSASERVFEVGVGMHAKFLDLFG